MLISVLLRRLSRLSRDHVKNGRVGTPAQIGIVTKYNFLNYFRARRFYVMLAIVVAISGLLSLVIAYRRPPNILSDPLAFYSTAWGAFLSLIIIIMVAFFGGDAISGEFQNRTGYFLVPNPLRRSAIYIGKWLAAAAAASLTLAAYAVIIALNGIYYFGTSLPSGFLQSIVFAWVLLAAALAFQFMFSSLFKSSAISILMGVIMLLFVFGVIDLVSATFIGIEPWFSITYGAGIVTNILAPTGFPQHVITTTVGGARGFTLTTYNATVPEGLAILVAYFLATGIVGLWLFERKEFTS